MLEDSLHVAHVKAKSVAEAALDLEGNLHQLLMAVGNSLV
jgi:hypothetical protein